MNPDLRMSRGEKLYWTFMIFMLVSGLSLLGILIKVSVDQHNANKASEYKIEGEVQSFRTVRDSSVFMSETSYYVTIDGREYPIDGWAKAKLEKGQWVHLEGDRNGVDVMETRE